MSPGNPLPGLRAWLLMAALHAAAPSPEAFTVAGSAYSLTFSDDLWTLVETLVPDTAYVLANAKGGKLTVRGGTLPQGLEPGAESIAAGLLGMAAGGPRRVLDSGETLGGWAFSVTEWRDPAAVGADTLVRARLYETRSGGVFFRAALRYKTGGCSSNLYMVREALGTLVIGEVTSLGRRIHGLPALEMGRRRDALGRKHHGGPRAGWSHAARRRPPPAPKPSACADLP